MTQLRGEYSLELRCIQLCDYGVRTAFQDRISTTHFGRLFPGTYGLISCVFTQIRYYRYRPAQLHGIANHRLLYSDLIKLLRKDMFNASDVQVNKYT